MTVKRHRETFGQDIKAEELAVLTKGCPCGKEERWKPEKLQEEKEVIKNGICPNCGRERAVSSTTGLCAFCERTAQNGMAKGATREFALAEAKKMAPFVYRGKRTEGLFPWDKEGWNPKTQEVVEESMEEKQEVKEETSSNALTLEKPFFGYSDPTEKIKIDVEMDIFDILTLEFGKGDQPLFESILELAKLHRREPDQEVMWILSKVIPMYQHNPPSKKGSILKICREEAA